MKKIQLIIVLFGCSTLLGMAQLQVFSDGTSVLGDSDFIVRIRDVNNCMGVRVEYHKTVGAFPFAAYRSGTRVFFVDDVGVVCAAGVNLVSDLSLKKNIEPIVSPLDKVMKLRGISFDMNFPEEENENPLPLDSMFESAKKRTPELTREIFDQIQQEKSRKRIGVIAQEVEKVLPELVRTREDGLKAVAYPEMVAVLIEAIKELKAEMDDLKEKDLSNNSFRSSTNETGTLGTVDQLLAQCTLYQNAPNPFNQNTQIRYYITEDVKTALLCIYNLQGSQIKQILVTERGEGSQWISGSELSAGMYLYALIADGKEVDVKRMILTR